jgi:DNA-binding MurR/RpiR family transcriptional regulator
MDAAAGHRHAAGAIPIDGTMSTRLALRIQERFEKLSPSERKLAALLLERQDDVLTYSATEMAELAGTSKATAARLFRSLGYSDFNEVRLQAREERNRTAPFEQRRAVTPEPAGSRSISNHLQAEMTALTRTFEALRSDRLALAARLVAEAPRVWLLAFGLDEGLARSARLQFARLRPDVQLLALQPGNWGEDLAMTGPRDALLLFLSGERPRVLKPMLDYARTTRMQVVAVSDNALAAFAARYAAVVLPCHAASPAAGAASATMASMTRLLAAAVEERIGAAATQRSDLIAEIDEELDHLE